MDLECRVAEERSFLTLVDEWGSFIKFFIIKEKWQHIFSLTNLIDTSIYGKTQKIPYFWLLFHGNWSLSKQNHSVSVTIFLCFSIIMLTYAPFSKVTSQHGLTFVEKIQICWCPFAFVIFCPVYGHNSSSKGNTEWAKEQIKHERRYESHLSEDANITSIVLSPIISDTVRTKNKTLDMVKKWSHTKIVYSSSVHKSR